MTGADEHMTTRRAQCSCGQLTLVAIGDPSRISVCHCLACQRRTGSAFGSQARFARDQVQIEGQSNQYRRAGDSGQVVTFHFCPNCATTLYWELEHVPEAIAVALGAFADPTFPSPKVSVYESRKHAWVDLRIDADLQREP